MQVLRLAFIIAYMSILIVFAVYGVHRYWLLFLYFKNRRKKPYPAARFERLPRVTVQLPMYNEKYVAERLIDAVCEMRYPKELLEIQVLDDSTDDTLEIVRRKVEEVKKDGFDIVLLHREDRTGFKAGALQQGLKSAKGEFIAIFDADFVPSPDLLEKSIHFFTDPGVGLVQSRWGHLNRNYSPLTEVQSIVLDGHFAIEHVARCRSGRFFNFNGTAGIWRKKAIEVADGWQHDTLTEDLDLSYRAQLCGWRFVFVEDVVSPAELPIDMNSFKSQQHHWTKGFIQTCLKMLPTVLRARIPLKIKIEAFFHLTGNFCYVLMAILSLMMLPSLFLRDYPMSGKMSFLSAFDFTMFFLTMFPFVLFYFIGQLVLTGCTLKKLTYLPLMVAVGIGLIFNNAKAVLEAVFGHQTDFPRTPKYNVTGRTTQNHWRKSEYKVARGVLPFIEISLGLYFIAACVIAIHKNALAALPPMMLFAAGNFYVGLLSVVHHKATSAGAARRTASEADVLAEAA